MEKGKDENRGNCDSWNLFVLLISYLVQYFSQLKKNHFSFRVSSNV